MPTHFATIPEFADYLNEGYWDDTDSIFEFRGPRSWNHQTITVNMSDLTTVEQNLAQLALSTWSDVADLNFVIGTGDADIWFWNNTPDGSSEPDAFTRSDVSSGGLGDDLQRADIYITSNWWNNGDTRVDGYLYQTYVHEIGHALGLGHPGPYNNNADYSTDAIFTNDTWRWSIMSYFDQNEASSSFADTFAYVLTPQMADIYAVQGKYGSATNTRTGNTTYGFNSNAGLIYDFNNSFTNATAFTIYDSAGTDTLDASNYGMPQILSLESGTWSSTGGAVNNIGIALSATIENAIGGSAGDQIFGNHVANALTGGGGNDTVNGRDGNDILDGGTGDDLLNGDNGDDSLFGSIGSDTLNGGADNDFLRPDEAPDVIDGGAGTDTVDFSTQDSVVVTLAGATTVFVRILGNSEDSMLNVENVIGGFGADTITGDFNSNFLFGGPGDDTIDGGSSPAQDTLNGGTGIDTVTFMSLLGDVGVNVNLSVTGPQNASAAGIDTILNFDNLTGTRNNDTLVGDFNDNVIDGGGGSDSNDDLDGAGGIDTASYASSPNGVNVSLAISGIQNTGAGLDILRNFENLVGSGLADTLIGNGNANRLRGGFGADTLRGGLGDDVYVLDTVHRPQMFDPFQFDTVLEAPREGFDTVLVQRFTLRTSYTLAAEIERGIINTTGSFALFGNGLSNTLLGNAGADVLGGRGGADTLDGGVGLDTADFSDKTAAVVLTLNGSADATATVDGSPEDTIRNIENATGGFGNDTLIGDGLANKLDGGSAGADTLTGGGGADTLIGGDGDDEFRYLAASDVESFESVDGGSGTDTLHLSHTGELLLSFATLSNIERIVFANGTGSAGAILGAYQFDSGISKSVQFTGSNGQNLIDVVMGGPTAFSAADWTFAAWDAASDRVRVSGSFGADTLTGSSQADHILGEFGDDILTGGGGDDILDGGDGAGDDTLDGGDGRDTGAFAQSVRGYNLQDFGSHILVTGPNSTDTLKSIEALQFADATIRLDDGDPLFDGLFYYSSNPDVFQAGADGKAHYDAFGWQEGRDPEPFFSSHGYLSANGDVRAAEVNPLEHFRNYGSGEGRDPSAAFDLQFYLVHAPDVRAAGVDPLAHYLVFGRAEGRLTSAAVGPNIANGFDAEYYLLANPDVGFADVDPLLHFGEFGWEEGRDPNAFFDTSGYLATYVDVAAAEMNPLDHYMAFGWTEGRDPSAHFDTHLYLAANPDVDNANINPLQHFLQFGLYEGRLPANDGFFG